MKWIGKKTWKAVALISINSAGVFYWNCWGQINHTCIFTLISTYVCECVWECLHPWLHWSCLSVGYLFLLCDCVECYFSILCFICCRAPIFAEEILGGESVECEVLPPPERSFWAKYVSIRRLDCFLQAPNQTYDCALELIERMEF